MKVKVKTEFQDKYTGELHRTGDVLDLNVQRINEILKVGCFVELVERSEQSELKQSPVENADVGDRRRKS